MADQRETEILTVAAVREAPGGAKTQYLFNERQQIFTFRAETKTAALSAGRLRESFSRNVPVKVRLDGRRGFIERVADTSAEERAAFAGARRYEEKPAKPRRIDVGSIDPTTFNIVDHYLKFPPFARCARTVPGYRKAKEIFDYCAAQSCHLPGPRDITPCIPFQYVRDGCYARAHKMRWIITGRYRYCCEKVFSFANRDFDVLAVTADKWGGCCVTWWYHVAPLLRVKIRLPRISRHSITLAMVIDPGMFDKPVLLSTWLSAQEKTLCDADARVSMYSIQPGSAYSPANYAGTAFTTDPGYTATDATLVSYSGLVTCP